MLVLYHREGFGIDLGYYQASVKGEMALLCCL